MTNGLREREPNGIWILLAVVLTVMAILMLSSCSPRIIHDTQTIIEYRDSTVLKDTTIYVPIPVESQTQVVLPKDTSRVETSLAESSAWVDTTGLLHHSIRNKRGEWGVQLKYPERTIVSKATTTTHDSIIVEKKVPASLTWWQRLRLWAFPLLLVLCLWAYKASLWSLLKKGWPIIKTLIKL